MAHSKLARAPRRPPTRPPARWRPAAGAPPKAAATNGPLDAIPAWSQLKLDIVRRYGAAYSTISSRQPGLAHYWIDGFIRSGTDTATAPRPHEFAPGSALNALLVTPPFRHHYLVNLDGQRVDAVRRAVGGRADVTLLEGDATRALLEEVLPRVRQEDYRRALCVLDPCPPGPDWRVIELAGRLRTIDLFVAFADTPEATPQALTRRLREDARFANVMEPLALRDHAGRTAAHLFFASRNNMANGVVEDIFTTHRDGRAAGAHG
jgi:hypothetical protein